MTKQLLLLCYYFPPAPLAFANRVGKLCKYLARETEWCPQVICGELPFDVLPGRDDTLLAEIPSQVGIDRVPSFSTSRLARQLKTLGIEKPVKFLRKFFVLPDDKGDWIGPVVRAAVRKFPDGKGLKALLVSGPPNSVYMAGYRLSKSWNLPLVIDMRDPWSQPWAKYNWFSNWLNWATRGMERRVYQQASAIITNTDGNLADLKRRFTEYDEKISVVPNGFDPEDILSGHGPALRDSSGAFDSLNLLYLGGLRGGGFEEPFFRVLGAYLDEHPKARQELKMHFVGGTQEQVENLVRGYGIADVSQAHGIVPANAVGRPLAESDIYILILPQNCHEGWIPAKFYYYLAGGKYIFALVPKGSVRQLLKGLGDLVEVAGPGEVEKAAAAFQRIIERARHAKKTSEGHSFPDYALQYDRRAIARQVAAVLDQVAGPRPAD
jgi:glycosyltransferase involved in cell wall biosynthesis